MARWIRIGYPGAVYHVMALAWWLREGTTAPLRWVSERLGKGHHTRVGQAVSRMERRPGRKLAKLKRQQRALAANNHET